MAITCSNNIIQHTFKARFKRRILHAPNAIQTMHNEEAYLIIYCLNCIRCMQNSTFETGLTYIVVQCRLYTPAKYFVFKLMKL